jgi:hypothetical protein
MFLGFGSLFKKRFARFFLKSLKPLMRGGIQPGWRPGQSLHPGEQSRR